MQGFGRPAHGLRNGRAASRLRAATTPPIEAARRRDAIARGRGAMAAGLTADRAAKAVGVKRAPLDRRVAGRRSPRPKAAGRIGRAGGKGRARAPAPSRNCATPTRCGASARSPCCCAARASLLGFDGRILAHLGKRGAVIPVPILRRRPTTQRIRLPANERSARRLPKGRKPKAPGERGQIATLFVNVRPDKPITHVAAYDPVAKGTLGRVSTEARAIRAKSSLDNLLREAPFPIRGIPVDGGAEFPSVFEAECQARGLALFVLPPKHPDGCVARAQSTRR